MENQEKKICKECGRELPISEFMVTRWGTHTDKCKKCINEKKKDTIYSKINQNTNGGGKQNVFYSDPDFDGKQPVDVLQMMKRAKMWLEAKGYNITLKGTYTQVREVKF